MSAHPGFSSMRISVVGDVAAIDADRIRVSLLVGSHCEGTFVIAREQAEAIHAALDEALRDCAAIESAAAKPANEKPAEGAGK